MYKYIYLSIYIYVYVGRNSCAAIIGKDTDIKELIIRSKIIVREKDSAYKLISYPLNSYPNLMLFDRSCLRLSCCMNALNCCVHNVCLRGWVYVVYVGHIDKIMKPFSML
jgi:hypothetical protein